MTRSKTDTMMGPEHHSPRSSKPICQAAQLQDLLPDGATQPMIYNDLSVSLLVESAPWG
ncbi:MAG: hypothetical protein AAFO75_12150 [Pseudomonadota bacterium]